MNKREVTIKNLLDLKTIENKIREFKLKKTKTK